MLNNLTTTYILKITSTQKNTRITLSLRFNNTCTVARRGWIWGITNPNGNHRLERFLRAGSTCFFHFVVAPNRNKNRIELKPCWIVKFKISILLWLKNTYYLFSYTNLKLYTKLLRWIDQYQTSERPVPHSEIKSSWRW